jgi:CRP/FNR family transcriptional regulator
MDSRVAAKIEEFFSQYRSRKYSKGQILILNGDQTDYVYQLVSGHVKEYDVTYHGDEIILNIFKPPAFFPMSLAINKANNPYIYEADTDVEIRQAPADEAVNFIKENPDVMFDLLSRVYRGVDGLLGRMTYLMASSARGRLIYELLVEAKRFGKQTNKHRFHLSLSEKDLGARAGLSRETVSREISKLKKAGLVTVSVNSIVLVDSTALEKLLGQSV